MSPEVLITQRNSHQVSMKPKQPNGHTEADEIPNVLVLAPSDSPSENEACSGLLTGNDPGQKDVLSIALSQPPDERLSIWRHQAGEFTPAQMGIISVSETTTSAHDIEHTDSLSKNGTCPMSIKTLSSPSNLTNLGNSIDSYLSQWADNGNLTVLCFHSVTTLLRNADFDRAYQLLELVTQRVTATGAIAHYHLDPNEYSRKEVSKLKTLFDEVIDLPTDGDVLDATAKSQGIDGIGKKGGASWHSYRISPDERPTEAVVKAVAAMKNVPTTELDPLADTVDPDALSELLSHANQKDTALRLTFNYSKCEVDITNRYVRVRLTT